MSLHSLPRLHCVTAWSLLIQGRDTVFFPPCIQISCTVVGLSGQSRHAAPPTGQFTSITALQLSCILGHTLLLIFEYVTKEFVTKELVFSGLSALCCGLSLTFCRFAVCLEESCSTGS